MNYLIRSCAYSLIMIMHKLKNSNVIFEYGSKSPIGTIFEGRNKLSHHCFFSGEIGYASYIGANSVVVGKIGKFCSIAENVTFLTKTHPVQEFVSTHPAFYSIKRQSGFTYVDKQMFNEEPILKNSKYSIEVGNDVYIGYGATIIGPRRIGDGAVIAAGAVVTCDVPPYAIVAGVPAKVIKQRFSNNEIEFLEKLEWWNKSDEWLKEHAKYFCSVETLKALKE